MVEYFTEDEPKIKRKALLHKVLAEGAAKEHGRADDLGRGYAEAGNDGLVEATRRDERGSGTARGGAEGSASPDRPFERGDTGIRSSVRESVDPTQGVDAYRGRVEESVKPPPSSRSSRKKPEPVVVEPKAAPRFQLKMPFGKTSDRLFTQAEADDELTRLTEIYFRGSGLLDDVLEIIVKDHEPVQIWQLGQDEAEQLAFMHLERAKRDKEAARSARKLLEIYDRLYLWMIVVPRVQATGRHVKEHKGLGFR
jgi:hypothetical protein